MRNVIMILTLALFICVNVNPTESQEVILSIRDGYGTPGSDGNIVQVDLDNTTTGEIAAIQMDLGFDSQSLSIADILQTQRTSDSSFIAIFDWNQIQEDVLRIGVIKTIPGISAGNGSIADIFIDVPDDALPGQYVLHVIDVIVADQLGNEMNVQAKDGIFTILTGFVLRIPETGGMPGSSGDEVPLVLSNRMALSELSLNLSFDAVVLSLKNVSPSDRTHDMGLFQWTMIESGTVHLSIVDSAEYISPDSGAIATFIFSVVAGAALDSYPLHLSEGIAIDSSGDSVAMDLIDASFTVGYPDITLSAGEHDFGEVSVGDTSVCAITVTNVGQANLLIKEIVSDNVAFLPENLALPQTLFPGREVSVDIAFIPKSIGEHSGLLSVVSSDPDEDTAFIALNGVGKRPHLTLSDIEVTFQDVEVCDVSCRTITLSNTGIGPLMINAMTSDEPAFQVASPVFPQAISASSQISVHIVFQPQSAGLYSGTMDIASDDPDAPRVALPVSGEGVDGNPLLRLERVYGKCDDTLELGLWLYNVVLISRLEFNLSFDAGIISFLDAVAAPRAAPFSYFSVEISAPGNIHVQLFYENALLGEGTDDILRFVFDIVSCGHDAPVILNEIMALDAAGNGLTMNSEDGGLFFQPAGDSLFLGQASSDSTMSIILSNTDSLLSFQFNLLYDIDLMQVTKIKNGLRVSGIGEIESEMVCNGSQVVFTFGNQVLLPGIGPVAEIAYKPVGDAASCGAYLIVEVGTPSGSQDQFLTRIMDVEHIFPTTHTELIVLDGAGYQGSKARSVPIHLANAFDVASIAFTLSYDATVLNLAQIVASPRTEHMGRFEWIEGVPGQIRILLVSDGDSVVTAGEGPIVDVRFDVRDDAPPGVSDLIPSDVVLIDTRNAVMPISTRGGLFIATSGSPCGSNLCIGQGYGYPGSSEVVVPVVLNKEGEIAAIQFDLLFDTSALHVIRVDKTDRTTLMDLFIFRHIQGGIRVAAVGIGHCIYPGSGPVVDIVFEIPDNAPPGAYWMEITGVVAAHPLGAPYDLTTEGNWFTILGETEVESTGTAAYPQDFDLGQNYPNPFNPATAVNYQIPMTKSQQYVTLKVFNVLGQEVRTLVDEYQSPGYYTVAWDGKNETGGQVPCGVYFYRLSVNDGQWTETKRMVLLR